MTAMPPSALGKKIINNGKVVKYHDPLLPLPDGFQYGRLKLGFKWITDGVNSKTIKVWEEIPDGWRAGRTSSEKTREIKRRQSAGENNPMYGTKGELSPAYQTILITDGTQQKRIKKTDDIPFGWYAGMSDVAKANHSANTAREKLVYFDEEQLKILKNIDLVYEDHIKSKLSLCQLDEKYGFYKNFFATEFRKRGLQHKTHTFGGSAQERDIGSFLKQNNIDYISNDRKLLSNGKAGGQLEIDILIPSAKLGIELNGLYWHEEQRKGKKLHITKHKKCKSLGYTLLQFWDIEILEKIDIVKSIIGHNLNLSKNKIYARKTKIVEVDSQTASDFLNNNHIQGEVSAPIRYGLTLNNNLIALMTFSKARFSNHEWEMIRFCSLLNTSIVGGANKLFQHFINTHNPNSVVTYADIRLFDGKVYEKLGFSHSHNTPPAYFYFIEEEYWLHNRMSFQKKLLSKKLERFDPNLTEYENMRNNGWYRVWDCGQSVWVWNKD